MGSAVAEWTYYVPDGNDGIDRQYANGKRLAERGSQKRRGNERRVGSSVHGGFRRAFYELPHPGQAKAARDAADGGLAREGPTRLHRSGRVVLLAVRSLGIGGDSLYRVPDPDARFRANPLRADAEETSTLSLRSRGGGRRRCDQRSAVSGDRLLCDPDAAQAAPCCANPPRLSSRETATGGGRGAERKRERTDRGTSVHESREETATSHPDRSGSMGACHAREGDFAAGPIPASLKRRETRSVLCQRGAV